MNLTPQDRADMLRDGMDPARRQSLLGGDQLMPPVKRSLEECLNFLDAVQQLRPNPPTQRVPHYTDFKL